MNVNADIAAGEIAAALGAEKLIFLTDIAGICDKSGKVIPELDTYEAEELITSGVATSGMIPKIRSGIRALDKLPDDPDYRWQATPRFTQRNRKSAMAVLPFIKEKNRGL